MESSRRAADAKIRIAERGVLSSIELVNHLPVETFRLSAIPTSARNALSGGSSPKEQFCDDVVVREGSGRMS